MIVGYEKMFSFKLFPLVMLRGLRTYSSDTTVKVVSAKGQFICYHPPEETFYHNSKPLKPQHANKNTRLTPMQKNKVKELRLEDPKVWTVGNLAKLFNVTNQTVRHAVAASLHHQQYLENEKVKLKQLKPHKRKLYVKILEQEQQQRFTVELGKRQDELSKYQISEQ
ncbi:uncharacterized protein [Dysidea avara]|uniref:uncharacterized protein n=1 Tax=Dysidea avara TaxID=196820 RepID=UPI00332D74C5